MRYIADVDGQRYEIDITDDGESPGLSINGERVEADLRQVTQPSLFSLLRDGQSYEVFVEPADKGYAVIIAGERFAVNVADERSLRLASVQKRNVERRGDLLIKSPMPGLVLDVVVRVGDRVEAGQPLVILSAMKMENEIRAFQGGVITAVHVQNGDKVEVGQKLVVIG